ncbi:MAG TPA: serine hydrolase domain-containing protein [Gaiellaceae bacterium]|nr:serine hydrolase domain-containing protein [Gaiellaceae bacterium]
MNASLRDVCREAREAWEVPALVVSALVDGQTTTVALGADADARFRIASVTKPMVATLVLRLLDVDEGTGGIWPSDVRVRHLLAHTSGYDCELPDPDTARFGDGDDALVRCVAELPDVRRLVGADEAWSYANTGYWLAGFLAAARAASTFEDALTERVLEPAGLEATSFDEPDLEGHGRDVPPPPFPRARRPSGGLTSTVADLVRYALWHLAQDDGGRLRTVQGKPVAGVYGLGLFGERVAGEEVWGHSGSYGGFTSSLLTVPARGAVFAGLTNSELGTKALRTIEDAWLEQAVGARRRVPPTVELPREALEAVAGCYRTPDGPVQVEAGGEGLVAHLPDGAAVHARPIAARTFEIVTRPYTGERFDFPLPGFARVGSRLAERIA